jgi:hypothetical protein
MRNLIRQLRSLGDEGFPICTDAACELDRLTKQEKKLILLLSRAEDFIPWYEDGRNDKLLASIDKELSAYRSTHKGRT